MLFCGDASALRRAANSPTSWRIPLRDPADAAVDWMKANLYQIGDLPIGTGPFSDFLTLYLLNPMRTLLRDRLSWPVVMLAHGRAGLSGPAAGGWRCSAPPGCC